MAYDIHGDRLQPGHCEVHPWVHCEYPCPVCVEDERQAAKARADEDAHYSAMEDEYWQSQLEQHMEQIGFDPIAMGA